MNLTNLQIRRKIINAIRDFFEQEKIIEIDTPIRLTSPALEDYIEAIDAGNSFGENFYLRTSPELHLKRFLAESKMSSVFQIGSCFRHLEKGEKHQEEFTMLEWYRINCDYQKILEDTINLFRFIATKLKRKELIFDGKTIDIFSDWEILEVKDAFINFAKISPEEAIKKNLFDEIITEKIEPNLGKNCPTILKDYPAQMAALSKISEKNPQICERWELYISGIELANCYTELTDAKEQRERFEKCANLRKKENRKIYPIDEAFIKSLAILPNCAGIALGIDRLCMIFCNTKNIREVIFL